MKEAETKHTPGPWEINEREGRIAIWPAIDREAQQAATHYGPFPVPGLGNFPSSPIARIDGVLRGAPVSRDLNETDRANARLIAAAPEMLDALQAITARMRLEAATGAPIAWLASSFYHEALAAIAKAEGKA